MSEVKEKLLRMLFPEGMLDHFEITRVDEIPGAGGGVQIELVEFPDVPLEFEEREITISATVSTTGKSFTTSLCVVKSLI